MAELVLGPILRYVDERVATVWVQTDAACEVEILGSRERTWCVAGLHFALVAVDGLSPGADHPYEVRLDGSPVWPPADTPYPPSAIRLLDRARRGGSASAPAASRGRTSRRSSCGATSTPRGTGSTRCARSPGAQPTAARARTCC